MSEEKSFPERVIIPMTKDMVERVQNYRFMHRLESRSQAIRQLVEIALKSEEKKNSKK